MDAPEDIWGEMHRERHLMPTLASKFRFIQFSFYINFQTFPSPSLLLLLGLAFPLLPPTTRSNVRPCMYQTMSTMGLRTLLPRLPPHFRGTQPPSRRAAEAPSYEVYYIWSWVPQINVGVIRGGLQYLRSGTPSVLEAI